MRLRPLILAALCLATALAGCRSRPAPTPVAEGSGTERPTFEGSLGDFVVTRPTAWVRIDAAAIRDDERLRDFWPAGEHDDPIEQAAAEADEVLLVWPDLDLSNELRIVRAPMDRDAVLDTLRSGENFAGRPFRPSSVGSRMLWRPADSDQAISLPWSNVIVTGPWEPVELAISREASRTSGPWRDRRFAGHFEAGFHVDPLHAEFAHELISNAEFVEAVRQIESVVVAARLGESIDVRVVFEVRRGANLQRLSAIVRVALALAITELGVPELAGLWNVEVLTDGDPAIAVIGAIPDALVAPLAEQLLAPDQRTGIPDDWLSPATDDR